MQNNMGIIMQAVRNPQAFIQQAMGSQKIMSNPLAKNALEMYQQGDVEGVKAMAENLCKEKGTTIDDVKNNLLSKFGM